MNVLITGTSSGIGKAAAQFFLQKGHQVYGFDRKESAIQEENYTHYQLDIREKEKYPALPPIHILVNRRLRNATARIKSGLFIC